MEQPRTVHKHIAKHVIIQSDDSAKTHLPGQAGFLSLVCAEAQLQQERTGTKVVSDFSHPALCAVLNDWGAFWSTAATPPHPTAKQT